MKTTLKLILAVTVIALGTFAGHFAYQKATEPTETVRTIAEPGPLADYGATLDKITADQEAAKAAKVTAAHKAEAKRNHAEMVQWCADNAYTLEGAETCKGVR